MEICTFPATWIYCRYMDLLHLGFGDVDLDICRLLVGVPAYYIVRTGAREGVVLRISHIAHAQMGFISD